MDVRCSNSVAVLAVLIGTGAWAMFAPMLRAGERIDFSAPAIPLKVQKPEVELKAPPSMIGSPRMAEGFAGSAEMSGPAESYYPVKSKTHGDDTWGLEPLLGDESGQRKTDDVFNEPFNSNRATNSNNLKSKPGLNPNGSSNPLRQNYDSESESDRQNSGFSAQNGLDSDEAKNGRHIGLDAEGTKSGRQIGLDADKAKYGRQIGLDKDNMDSSRLNGTSGDDAKYGTKNPFERNNAKFGARNGFDRDYSKGSSFNGSDKDAARTGDFFGRASSGGPGDSLWTRDFGHDASVVDRFTVKRWSPGASDGRPFGGGALEDRMSNPWLGQDRTPAQTPPSYPGFATQDTGPTQANEQAWGGSAVSLRAWDPGASTVLPPRTYASPEQVNSSHFVQHAMPAIIPMPKRPGDPY